MRYISIAIIASLLRSVTTDVTCTAGTFSMGTKGFVRCDLGKDVRTGKYQFSVVHCEDALCDAHTKTYPLVCNINDGNLQCDADLVPGYSFDRLVDSSLTLIVTTVNRNTTGLYYCQVMGDGSPRHTCDLSPTGPPAVTAGTPMSHSSTTGNPGIQAHADSERTADLQGFPVKFVVVLAVLLAVLVVCGLLVSFLVFIRYKNSRRPESQEDIEAASSLCETFAVFCKCLTPPPKPQPPMNPKADASEGTPDVVMMDKEVQVSDGKHKQKGIMKRFGLSKSTEDLFSDTGEDRQVENKDAKMGESKLQHDKNQDEKVAGLPPVENQDDKMAKSESLLREGNLPVDEAGGVAVSSEIHTGASPKTDEDVKKKSKKSHDGFQFKNLWRNKTKKSSDNPETTETGEEKELTNMDGIKTEESKLLPEENQDTKMAESELAPKDKQDEKMAESVPLLGEDNPTVVEAEEVAIGSHEPAGASPKTDDDNKNRPEKSPSKGFFGKSSKGSKKK